MISPCMVDLTAYGGLLKCGYPGTPNSSKIRPCPYANNHGDLGIKTILWIPLYLSISILIFLVGGSNPSEKYESHLGWSFPTDWENKIDVPYLAIYQYFISIHINISDLAISIHLFWLKPFIDFSHPKTSHLELRCSRPQWRARCRLVHGFVPKGPRVPGPAFP